MHLSHPTPLSLAVLFLYFLCINAHVSINCGGSAATSAARNGREWSGDANPDLFSLLQIKGSSTASGVVIPIFSSGVDHDPVPYGTARFSKSRFSYEFRMNPGEKILRLHFHSASYKGFRRFEDFFDVQSGPFTLVSNFSVSLTADALGVKSFVKEFCIKVEENELLDLVFSPASSPLLDTYAFINGIEIVSVPSSRSCFHVENTGLQMVGKSLGYVGSNTVMEIVSRVNFRNSSVSPLVNDFDDLLRMWDSISTQRENEINNITWRVSVDVGFRYLVRLYFSRIGFERAEIGLFKVCINEMIPCTNIDMVRDRDAKDCTGCHRDFMVSVNGCKQEGKHDILVYIETSDEFLDGHGVLEGFEVIKLSNTEISLASPKPVPAEQDLSSQTIKNLLQVLGQKNVVAFFAIAVLSVVNIIIYMLQKFSEDGSVEEENIPSTTAERLCRRFSLAEIKLATRNFNAVLLIGRGGFGKVYKGLIDNGQKTVAIKRLKSNSSQGAQEFLTEIDTLAELRHVNLVSLIGYCRERREMILVYEYMPCGSLADHLFKLAWDSNNHSSLTWRQCLNICIGSGRGLDYLHTGCSVIHRDVKASNILLDEVFVPKVSDFGLAKHLCRNNLQSHVTTKVKGTRGYFDPNYLNTGRLTAKSDVYAFGVVMLEVLCGRPALDSRVLMDEQILTKWVRECISQGNVEQIVAFNLRGEISAESLKTFLEVAESCLHDEPKKRPTMAKVVLQLEFALEQQESSTVPVPNRITYHGDNGHPLYHDVMTLVGRKQVTTISTDDQKASLTLKGLTNNKEAAGMPSTGRNRSLDERWKQIIPKPKPKPKPSRFWRRDEVWKRQQRPKAFKILVFSVLIKQQDMVFLEKDDDLTSLEMIIGRGRAGEVYTAVLPGSRRQIAIKKITESSGNGEEYGLDHKCVPSKKRNIESQIKTICRIRHRNILPLLAYQWQPGCHYLFYEYMPNGSLQDCLHQVADGRTELDWLARYKIALGIAAGLEHLHMNHSPRIIHRDLKPANILLDDDMEARIADFEDAEPIPDGYTFAHVTTSRVVGTIGYIAPEYYHTLKLSDKCDVYSFGMILGVLVTGMQPLHEFFRNSTELSMVKWMRNAPTSGDPRHKIDPLVARKWI